MAILVVLFAFAAPSVSAAGNSIVITNTSSNVSIEGKTFDLYKVLNVSVSGTAYSYTVAPEFAPFSAAYETAHPSHTLVGDLGAAAANSAALDAIATEIRAYILANASTVAAAKTTSSAVAAGTETVTVTGLALGYYIVTGEVTASGGTVIATSAMTTTSSTADVGINVKADAPKIEKKVWDVKESVDPDNTEAPRWQDVTDVNIGDTVKFLLTSNVPDASKYDTYKFIMHDTMSAGLTLDSTSFKVYVGGTKNAAAGITGGTQLTPVTDYVLSIPGTETGTKCSFEISFLKIKTYTKDLPIYVLYEAELNASAVIYDPGNPNKVNLEYSNNPYDGGTGTNTTPDDHVVVYTFDNDLLKFAKDDAVTTDPTDPNLDIGEKALAGAEFELYNGPASDSGRTKLAFVLDTAGTATTAAIYRPAVVGDTATVTTTLVAPASGRIKILGIDEGVYSLKETKAPAGYTLLAAEIAITIQIQYTFDEENAYTGTPATEKINTTLSAGGGKTQLQKIENVGGSILPETGSIGTMIFTIGGITLMVLAGIILMVRRRKTATSK